jgi:hypothetical protein
METLDSKITLYNISENLAALVNSVDTCPEELRADLDREIDEAISIAVQKVDNFARYLVHLESQEQLAGIEAKRLKQRENYFLRTKERLEQYAIRIMRIHGWASLQGSTNTLQISKRDHVHVSDPDLLRDEFMKERPYVRRDPDNTAIRAAIEAGEIVPGAELRNRLERK